MANPSAAPVVSSMFTVSAGFVVSAAKNSSGSGIVTSLPTGPVWSMALKIFSHSTQRVPFKVTWNFEQIDGAWKSSMKICRNASLTVAPCRAVVGIEYVTGRDVAGLNEPE